MNQYDKEIERLEEDFKKKKDELEKKSIESKNHPIPEEERELATFLHDRFCNFDHEAGCGWFYDKGTWTEYSRKQYLDKARAALKFADSDTVVKVLSAIR